MNLKGYLNKAQKEKWIVPQFNFSTLDQLRGILSACQKLKSPVILGTSEGESHYLGLKEIMALVEISKMEYNVPVFLNLDHGKDIQWIKKAIDYGYSAVHYDGSGLSLEKNIQNTKKIVEYAHKRGVLVEGELGYIGGESKNHKKKAIIREKDLTFLNQVAAFVRRTNIDSLAISIGNVHGVYIGQPKLDFERLKRINNETKVFLVLHGGSGIPKADIKKAMKFGIVKTNINTELRVVWKQTLDKQKETKPYSVLKKVENAITKKVVEKINLFESNNKI